MDALGREKDINQKLPRSSGFSVHLGSSKEQKSAKEGEVFKDEQVVLWGWKVEISTLLSKRVCIWKKKVGTTRESYCQKCRRPEEGLALEGCGRLDSPTHERSLLPNPDAVQGQLLTCKRLLCLALLCALMP